MESELLIIVNKVVVTRYLECGLNSYELPFEVVFEGVIMVLSTLQNRSFEAAKLVIEERVIVALESLVILVLLLVALESLVVLVLLLVALELPALVVSVLLHVSLVAIVVLESHGVPVLLLVAVESLVTLEVNDWIIASACDSVETIEVALAIFAVKELMEEEIFACEPKKLIFLTKFRNINSFSIRKNYLHYL